MQELITPELLRSAMTYVSYRDLLTKLLEEGKTTGSDQSETMVGYARLNQSRMNKWDKIGKLTTDLTTKIHSISKPMSWLVLTEGWCGDAAQCLPFINKMAQQNSLITLQLILRDKNLPLMDAHLTDGGRGIPKLIVLDEQLNVLGTWGPRPRPMQDLMLENKKTSAKSYEELSEEMHLWYGRDRGQTLQEEFLSMLDLWTNNID